MLRFDWYWSCGAAEREKSGGQCSMHRRTSSWASSWSFCWSGGDILGDCLLSQRLQFRNTTLFPFLLFLHLIFNDAEPAVSSGTWPSSCHLSSRANTGFPLLAIALLLPRYYKSYDCFFNSLCQRQGPKPLMSVQPPHVHSSCRTHNRGPSNIVRDSILSIGEATKDDWDQCAKYRNTVSDKERASIVRIGRSRSGESNRCRWRRALHPVSERYCIDGRFRL